MRPARSAILITVASGAGYGLLAMLGVLASSGTLPAGRWFAAVASGLALAAVGCVLLSAAWRHAPARLGALAAATWLAASGFATGWIFHGQADGPFRLLGLLTAALCGLTVHATGMIHTARTSIPAWNNRWVVPNFLVLALFTGTLWLNVLVNLFGRPSPDVSMVLVLVLFLAFYLKRKYWRLVDAIGDTGSSIARAHVVRLRRYAFLLLFVLPLVCALTAMETPAWIAIPASLLAALGASAGAAIAHWLFRAEAGAVVQPGGTAG